MVELMRYGRQAAAGEYICADCGCVIALQSGALLPICPNRRAAPHSKKGWRPLYGRATVSEGAPSHYLR